MIGLPSIYNETPKPYFKSIIQIIGEAHDERYKKLLKCEEVNYYYENFYDEEAGKYVADDKDPQHVWCGPKVTNFIERLLSADKNHQKCGIVIYATSAGSVNEIDDDEGDFDESDPERRVDVDWFIKDNSGGYIKNPEYNPGKFIPNPNYNTFWLGDICSNMEMSCCDDDFFILYQLMRKAWSIRPSLWCRVKDIYKYWAIRRILRKIKAMNG